MTTEAPLATASALLIVLRHGQAEPMRLDDASRALVPAGEREVRQSAAFLAEQGWRPQRIIASPYRRAQQTAQLVGECLDLHGTIETDSLLTPDADVQNCVQWLAASSAGTVLVASHMPLVADVVHSLSGQSLAFSTGSLVVLQATGDRWRVLAQFAPR